MTRTVHDIQTAFDYHQPTRIIFGPGCIARIGDCVRELGGKRVLLVTDPGIVAAGHARLVHELIEAGGHATVVRYDHVRENPTTRDVEQCAAVARDGEIDCIVGFGGGSSMDTAKGCNFIHTNGGTMQDYQGINKATRPMLPLIAIPTTAGTGSECQSFALIADENTHMKMACGDKKAAARFAILDPQLTLTQPRDVTVHTGMDALTHAVETCVTTKGNALSRMFSREAFRLIAANFQEVLEDGANMQARAGMLLGAALAGLAIENSMLGAAHSAANPLAARFGIVHGHAVGLMLPHVIRYNVADNVTAALYAQAARDAQLATGQDSDSAAVEKLIAFVGCILEESGLSATLYSLGISKQDIPLLAREAAMQWTAQFNPRSIDADGFVTLYEAAYS